VISLLNQSYPQHQAMQIALRWPVTGFARTVTITPPRTGRLRLCPSPPG
jgi:hypothetical protein